MEAIDTLPIGPKWYVQEITLKGEHGEEDVEFYYRDALECVEELMGNPMFKHSMKYAPERHWKGGKRANNRQYNECWTGDWWWKIQVSFPLLYRQQSRLTIIHRTSCRRNSPTLLLHPLFSVPIKPISAHIVATKRRGRSILLLVISLRGFDVSLRSKLRF
jgi:hypothetical protein